MDARKSSCVSAKPRGVERDRPTYSCPPHSKTSPSPTSLCNFLRVSAIHALAFITKKAPFVSSQANTSAIFICSCPTTKGFFPAGGPCVGCTKSKSWKSAPPT